MIAGIDLDLALSALEHPYAIRRRLQGELDSPDLYLDCARLVLSQVVSQPDTQILYLDPRVRYTLQIFCWPPGFGNQPHHHDNWNVTGVMAGSLLIFRSATSESDCLASDPLLATCGQAGVLIPPQFHCLRNANDETAITFHVFSIDEARRDMVHLERSPTSGERLDDDGIVALATVAVMHGGADSIDIVRTAFSAASNAARLDLVKLMIRVDPLEAIHMARVLSQLVGGSDGRRLIELVERLERATSTVAL